MLGIGVSLSAFLWPPLAHANVAVQVRGFSRLVARIAPSSTQDELWVQGQLLDDQGQPIAGAALAILAATKDGEAISVTPLGSCPASADSESAVRLERQVSRGSAKQGAPAVVPLADGSFCVRIAASVTAGGRGLRVEFPGSDAYEGTHGQLAATDLRAPLIGHFTNLAHQVSLDDERTSFQVSVAPMGGSLPRQLPEGIMVELLLRDAAKPGADTQLRRLTLHLGEPMAVTITRSELGGPGPAELLAAFAGTDQLQPFRITQKIVRTVQVTPLAFDLPGSATRGDRVPIAFGARSRLGPVEHGAVELGLDDARLLVEPLSRGNPVEFVVATQKTQNTLRLNARYLPSREGYLAGPPVSIHLPLRSPGPWRYAVWLIPGLAVLCWLGLSRRNPRRAANEPTAVPPQPPSAHVEIIGPPSQKNLGWEGFLVDAHEGTPLSQAQVIVQERGFTGSLLVHSTISDDNGAFAIPSKTIPSGTLELVVRAGKYMEFRTDLPMPGLLRIHLISIRRGLLDRLVEWTKRRGSPYRSKSEPTPDWVAQVARVRGQPEIEQWAKAVAIAAFRQEPPADSQEESLLPPVGPAAAEHRGEPES